MFETLNHAVCHTSYRYPMLVTRRQMNLDAKQINYLEDKMPIKVHQGDRAGQGYEKRFRKRNKIC